MMRSNTSHPLTNLLPQDGTVHYYGKIFSDHEAQSYFEALLHTIAWKQDELIIFGTRIVTKRKAAWYANDGLAYTYSHTTKRGLPWTNELLTLKSTVEQYTGTPYNSCLLNLYHDGEEGMGWHSDNEKSLGLHPNIASVSFGADRKFVLQHKENKQTISVILENGSLLLMKDATQTYWLHSLTKSRKVKTPRINLTFRTIVSV